MIPSRTQTITQKIPRAQTGLNGSLFVHIGFVDRSGVREITSVRVSEKSKDGCTLDNILTAIGDTITSVIQENINRSNVVEIGSPKP